MKVLDNAIEAVSAISRQVPQFRGLDRLYRTFNSFALKVGQPTFLVDAKMLDGTLIKVDIRSNTELEAYYRGTYDKALIDTIKKIMDPNKTFLDIGANVGFYTVSIASWIRAQRSSGRVLAFEPVPGNFQRIAENVIANDLQDNVEVFRYGLSDTAGETAIVLREDFAQGSTRSSIEVSQGHRSGLRCLTPLYQNSQQILRQLTSSR